VAGRTGSNSVNAQLVFLESLEALTDVGHDSFAIIGQNKISYIFPGTLRFYLRHRRSSHPALNARSNFGEEL
jgi:hypothetical protein